MGANTATVQKLYVAFFNRPGDALGQAFWEGKMDAGMTEAQVAASFAQSTEYTSVYGSLTTAQTVSTLYTNLFGRAAAASEITFWGLRLLNGQETVASIARTLANSAQGTDATAIANKISAATSFTNGLTTTDQIVGYSGTAANAVAKAWLANVTSDAATLTAATASLSTTITSATTAGANSTGSTFTLTSGVDTLTGTSGNDTFVADNTGTNAQLTVADQINGGSGTDTLKVFTKAGTAVTLPTLTSIESLYVNGDDQGLSISAQTGITSLTVDQYAGSKTYTVKGQSVTLLNETAGGLTTTIDSGTDATLNLTVGSVGKSTSADTIDVKGTATTLSLKASTGASTVALTNTGTKLTGITLSGDQKITLTGAALSQAGLTKIDASAATGAVSVDATNAVTDKAFAFTGGSGNDTLKVKAAEFGTLTSGAQLDGGAGTDTLQINDTTPVYAKLNQVKNFEVLQLGTTAATVDISQLTSFNKFSVASGNFTETFNNALSTSTFAIDNSGATTSVTIANKVGETATSVTIDNQAGAAKTLGTLTLTGATNIALASTGNTGSSNVITTFNNGDNSAITLTGNADVTFTLSATNTGSKVDGSAFTGVATITGSAKADVLIGGTGADVFTTGGGADTLTGGAGKDTFQITGAAAGTATSPITITDFVSGTDVLKIKNAAANPAVNGTAAVTSAKVDVSTATTLAGALDLAAAGDGSTTSAIKWFTYGSDTYVVVDNSSNATLQAADAVIKLVGITSITTSTDIVVY